MGGVIHKVVWDEGHRKKKGRKTRKEQERERRERQRRVSERARAPSVGNHILSIRDKGLDMNYPRLVKQGGGEVGHIIHAAVH